MTYLCSLPVLPSVRSRLASTAPLFTCIGIVASYACGLWLPWRLSAGAGASLAVVAFLCAPLMRPDDQDRSDVSTGDRCSCITCIRGEDEKCSRGSKELIIVQEDNKGFWGQSILLV